MTKIIILLIVLFNFIFISQNIQAFQQEYYKCSNYFEWIIKNKNYHLKYIIFSIIIVLTLLFNELTKNNFYFVNIIMIITILIQIGFIVFNKKELEMKKVIKTSRSMIIVMFASLLLLVEIYGLYLINNIFYFLMLLSLTNIITQINIMLANIALIPIQKFINYIYIREAKKILEIRKDLITIGITGSYGKTNTKFILETILKEKYNIMIAPNSCNTLLGNVAAIRENLRRNHDVYIAEMSAQKNREIKKMCSIFKPKYGLITSIDENQLKKIKKPASIINNKYELIKSISNDGAAFFPSNSKAALSLYEKTSIKKYIYGINSQNKQLDVFISKIKVNRYGTKFQLCYREKSIECSTELLGEYNLQNILASVAIALELKLSLEEIKSGIAKLKTTKHHLQLISNLNGTITLDNTLNNNPSCTKVALEVLTHFNSKKIIMTAGIMEVDDKDYEMNKELSYEIAKSLDMVILIDRKRTSAIFDGLCEAKFPKEKIYIASNIKDAMRKLKQISKPGDIILLESSFPD